MSYPSIDQAFSRLLDKLSLSKGSADISSPKDVKNLLNGSGVDLEECQLIKGVIPVTEGVLGGVLVHGGESFTPFIKTQSGILSLHHDDEQGHVLSDVELLSFSKAWVLTEKKIALNKISPFLVKYKGRFFDLLMAALIINFFALVFPLFSSFVYDKILGNGITQTLWAVAICVFMIMIVEFCIRIVRVSAAERFAVGSETDIDYSIFQKLLDSNVSTLPNIGTLLEKYKQILSYRDFLSSSYLLSLADVPFLLLFLIAIAAVGGPMVFIAVVCGIAITLLSSVFIRPILEYDMAAKKTSERRFSLMADLLSAREVVIGSAFRNELQKKLRHYSVETSVSASKSRYWRGFNMTASNSLSYLSYVAVMIAGVYMVEAHQMTSGGLLAVSMLTSRALSSVSSVSGLILKYKEFRIAMNELNSLLPDKAPARKTSHGKLLGNVRFENVTCSFHQTGAPVLDKINLNIKAGEIVGIAGAPGSGKTTLLRLIAGATKPDSGKILIDGSPLDSISYDDLSTSLGYKPQELCLLEGSVEDNVKAGRADLNAQEREALLKLSGLEFPFEQSGLDWKTDIGSRGTRISGGQKQLVSLARALAYNPSLILLDEPTNGLDANLEAHVAKGIAQFRGKSTVLVSTHSHSILSICDRIIVIGQSKILADGPRDKILVPNQAS